MRRSAVLVSLALFAGPAVATAFAQDAPADPLSEARSRALTIEGTLVDSLAKVRRASASILLRTPAEAEPGKPAGEPVLVSCGSGVIVQRAGKLWVLTNHHVIDGAKIIEAVTFNGATHLMELHDTVPKYDIALLRFQAKSREQRGLKGVTVRKLAASKLVEGQWVIATGNPFFLATDGASVSTLGVVSGLERVLDGKFKYGKAIQHDAEVNPGNSGGPLWNLRGDLVGINGMIITRSRGVGPSNSGASFSIPMDQVAQYISRLVDKNKDANAGFLGLLCVTHTDAKGVSAGARVEKIESQSPVRSGGRAIREGDVIVSLTKGGKTHKVRTADDLTNALVLYPAGTAIKLKYLRNRKPKTWSGKLGQDRRQ